MVTRFSTLPGTTDTNSGNPLIGYFHFDLNGQHDIQAGETVTVSGGGFTKALFVKHLTLTSVNAETGQMTGTADPGSNMWICAWLGDHCNIRGSLQAETVHGPPITRPPLTAQPGAGPPARDGWRDQYLR